MPHEDTCPACQDFALYRDDRQAWARLHAPDWLARHEGLSAEDKRVAWSKLGDEMKLAVKELRK